MDVLRGVPGEGDHRVDAVVLELERVRRRLAVDDVEDTVALFLGPPSAHGDVERIDRRPGRLPEEAQALGIRRAMALGTPEVAIPALLRNGNRVGRRGN